MKLTVDIIDDFIQSLDLSGDVRSFSDDGTDTTLIVDNTFHARKGMVLDIDGLPFTILSVVFETSITVSGLPAAPFNYTVPLPFYFHGTPIATNNQISEADHKVKVPMIYLHEILKEKDKDIFSSVKRDSDVRLFFLDSANFDDWTTDEHYSQRLLGLNALVNAFRDQALKSELFFLDETEFSRVNHVKWGTFTDLKGHIKNIFDDKLTGVELSLTLPLTDCEPKAITPRLPCPKLDEITFDVLVAQNGRGAEYPQPTGQQTSFRTLDDADVEATFFTTIIRDAQTAKARQTLVSKTPGTLNNNNEFGNTKRWVNQAGNTPTVFGEILLDTYTRLMWFFPATVTGGAAVDWNTAIDNAAASTEGGFSDWFCPTDNQIMSWMGTKNEVGDDRIPAEFITVSGYVANTGQALWSSTTQIDDTLRAMLMFIRRNQSPILQNLKTVNSNRVFCRTY